MPLISLHPFKPSQRVTLSGRRPVTPEDAAPTPRRRPDGQHDDHWILPKHLRAVRVRPLRRVYLHERGCGHPTHMDLEIAETFAADPCFYSKTFCAYCRDYFPIDQFMWDDGDWVGS